MALTFKSTAENKREVLEIIDGRPRYAVARLDPNAKDIWDVEMELPDGTIRTERKRMNPREVSVCLSNLLDSTQREFNQMKGRDDRRTPMRPDLNVPMPSDTGTAYISHLRYRKD